jgi:hypothetical protein
MDRVIQIEKEAIMTKSRTKTTAILGALTLAATLAAGAPAKAASLTDCSLRYTMKEWSMFVKEGKGEGTITCDNGQRADVLLTAKGGGLTAGKGVIRDGSGKFSDVKDISELFGTYAEANATAGVGGAAGARAMTKGEVSLALSGKGTGVELGVSFGKFTITPR